MNKHGTGDKYTGTSSASVDSLGLTERETIDNQMKLRGETGESTQRPTAKTKKLGKFTDKC